jgi:type I restriction enzyme, S subunit
MSSNRLRLPLGWERPCLKDIAQIASGVAKGRRFNGSPTVWVPYLRVANVQAGHLDLSEIKVIEVLPNEVEKFRLETGDILMTEGGDRDKLGRGTIWHGQVEGCIHQNHVFRVRPNQRLLLPSYLNLYLGTNEAKGYFLRCAKQTTGIASVNLTQLSEFPVVLPPVAEQRRIAAILDKADAIRQKREEIIRLTEELLSSTFLEMFGDPERNPRGWDRVSLSSLLAVAANYGTMNKPHEEKEGWLDLRVMNIQDGKLDLSDEKYVHISGDMIDRHEVRDGDLLLARAIGSLDHLGKCIVVRTNGCKWAFDSHLMRLRFDQERVHPEYVRMFLTSSGGRFEFLKHARRSAVQFNINTKELARIQMPLPPVEEQNRFLAIADKIERMTSRRRKALAGSEACLASLVQRAFKGEL